MKATYFPFFPQDFLAGTLEFDAEEIGAYIMFLIYEWDKGFLPDNDLKLTKIGRISPKKRIKLEKVLEKFRKDKNGNWINPRLESERNKILSHLKSMSNAGINGNKVRWGDRQAIADLSPSDPVVITKPSEGDRIKIEENRIEENIKKKGKKEKVAVAPFAPPILSEVQAYFKENGFREDVAKRAFDGYAVADWHNAQGKKILNWKQTMHQVWFDEKNKIPIKKSQEYQP
jgi:uncharacterized protein YdaU (DUF1376 family)